MPESLYFRTGITYFNSVCYIHMKTTKQTLLLQAAAGDRTAFEELFAMHYYPLYNQLLLSERLPQTVVEDICLNIFDRLWCRKESLAEIGSLENYLKTAAHHAALDCREQQAAKEHVRQYSRQTVITDAEVQLIYKEGYEQATAFFTALSPRQQQISNMRKEQRLPFGEINQRVEGSVGRVKHYCYITRNELQSFLEKGGLLLTKMKDPLSLTPVVKRSAVAWLCFLAQMI
jgi:RNA polymerase sigma-70 factor (ECF subfamily)